jgi:tRNA dimethylallyltransferase
LEPKVIVIAGPTCSGKTSLAILLAGRLNSEIISADSRQIYKYLDIGTAKPDKEQLQKIRHHLISVLEPSEVYNASRFEGDALEIIRESTVEGKIPVIAGGSGLYIKALIDGIFDVAASDDELRERYTEKRKSYGNTYLYDELKNVDPESASRMLPQNWKRVMRALEVFYITGKTINEHHREQKRKLNFNFVQFGLRWDRQTLYKNIDQRVDNMISAGLVEETKLLIEKYDKTLNSLNTVGYKEIIAYLDNEIILDRAVELIKRNTRRFAKRQLTWFRADERIKWYDINKEEDLEIIADDIVRKENIL